jgi:type IV secretory pathway TrbL component
MHHKRTIAAAAALAVAVTPVAALAQEQAAAPPAKTAKAVGNVKRPNKKSATLKVNYSCKSGNTLWISLKQSKSGKKDPALKKEGSSAAAASWLQSHRNTITCDGTKRTAKFTVDKVEAGSKGKLKAGKAWLQFCVTSGTGDTAVLTVSVSGWVTVD